jgi:hypothetical protein
MLFLVAEIVLTIMAWNKGWKWQALLPFGIGYPMAFLIGLMIGYSGGNVADAQPVGFVIDLIILGILIAMVVKGKKEVLPINVSEDVSESVNDGVGN